MKKKHHQTCPRIDPEEKVCPAYDSTGIKLFLAPNRDAMGFRVVDDFPEEHIQ